MSEPGDAIEKFGEAMSDAIMALPDAEAFKKSKRRFIDELWDDIQYSVIDQMPEQLEWFVRDMAERTVRGMLEGRDDLVRRYLGLDGYTGRSDTKSTNRDAHPVIHGTLFETGAIALRKEIAQGHADLIRNERIADLEDQVASLVEQVNKRDREISDLRDRLSYT